MVVAAAGAAVVEGEVGALANDRRRMVELVGMKEEEDAATDEAARNKVVVEESMMERRVLVGLGWNVLIDITQTS